MAKVKRAPKVADERKVTLYAGFPRKEADEVVKSARSRHLDTGAFIRECVMAFVARKVEYR